ncbi:uncharacterized protein LOC122500455 [Leptopilina heterotoma]|uniref:uncharacterized protein LOC122500455 n=1 Tax=Leptopilina heterotoma TaxID=63436 RepID=UPI001CA7EF97|nr:uncharacterized protein LOC122500455 [Leptopilina heterotoma]
MLTRQRFNATKLLEVEKNTSGENSSSNDEKDHLNYSEHDTKSSFSDYSGNSETLDDDDWVPDNSSAKHKKQLAPNKGASKLTQNNVLVKKNQKNWIIRSELLPIAILRLMHRKIQLLRRFT